MNDYDSKVSSIRLSFDEREIVEMLGQGNRSKGIKVCINLIRSVLLDRVDIDYVRKRIQLATGETDAMRRSRNRLLNASSLINEPKTVKPNIEKVLTEKEIEKAAYDEEYANATDSQKFCMSMYKVRLAEALTIMDGTHPKLQKK